MPLVLDKITISKELGILAINGCDNEFKDVLQGCQPIPHREPRKVHLFSPISPTLCNILRNWLDSIKINNHKVQYGY